MAETTDRFALPLIQPGQAQKELFHNEAIMGLENRLHAIAEAIGIDTPPEDALPGQGWIVGSAPIAAWSGQADRLAVMTAGGWRFAEPVAGMQIWLRTAGHWAIWSGSGWNLDAFPVPGVSVGGVRVVSAQQSAITAPTGGATIDDEARTVLATVLVALRNHGLIAT